MENNEKSVVDCKISFNLIFNILFPIIALLNLFIINWNATLLFILMIFQLIVFLKFRTDILTKIICMIYFEVLLIMISFGMVVFEFMPQAKVMLSTNNDILKYFMTGHPHAIRLLIAYPGYLISNFTSIELNIAYSYYILMIFCILYINIFETCSYTIRYYGFYSYIIIQYIIFFVLIVLSFLMNGRIIFAFLGFSMIIKLVLKNNFLKLSIIDYIEIIIGIILTTVSSGTMSVVTIFIILVIAFIYKNKIMTNLKRNKIYKIMLCICMIPIIILALRYLKFMLVRNINYYGGGLKGLINMMNHGIGRYFNNSILGMSLFLVIVLFGVITAYFFVRFKLQKNEKVYIILFLAVISCMVGFVFGYSAGSLVLIPLIIISLIFLFKEKGSMKWN